MPAVSLRFRAEMSARWRAWVGLALVIGLAGGAVIALAAGARRTGRAYDRFLDAQNAFDVAIFNDLGGFGVSGGATASFDLDRVRRLPHVAEVVEAGYFFLFIAGAGAGVLVPSDQRLGTDVNRFKMLDGRRPDPANPAEVAVGFTLAEAEDLEVGDKIPLFDPALVDNPPPGLAPDVVAAAREARARILDVIPDATLTVVGIEASPGEFPPQIEGTGRYLVHASPALSPLVSDLIGFNTGGDALVVRLDAGERGVDAFLEDLAGLGEGAPPQLVVQRDMTASTDRSMGTQATALWVLALLTAVVAMLVGSQLLARLVVLESGDHPVLAALGMDRGMRWGLGLARAGVVGVVAAVVAVLVALAASPLFPTGLARTAEPSPGFHVDTMALALGALATGIVVVALSAWPAWRAARAQVTAGAGPAAARPFFASRLIEGRAIPLSIGIGARMALDPGRGQGSLPVRTSIAGVTLGVATLVAALIFGASLGHLLATPALYGQNWDAVLTTYDEVITTDGLPVLEDDARVAGLAVGDLASGSRFVVEGRRVDGLVFDSVKGGIGPSILEGRVPTGDDEIVLGTRTLRSLGLDVGDSVDVAAFATDRESVPMRVVGRAVFPVFGEAGRLGDGLFMTLAGAARVSGEPEAALRSGVFVRLAPGADLDDVVNDLTPAVSGLVAQSLTVAVIRQGKPTDIVNFGRVEGTPYLLGAILATFGVATLMHVLVITTRRRRRELAILKTLGFERAQLKASVAAQATTTVMVALLIGIPLGIAMGRVTWTLFADGLGVIGVPRIPTIAVVLTAAAALVLANVIAAVPAQLAARTRVAVVLRSE